MRVIAGELRGRKLKAPPGTTTRPTSDRVREGLFSAVEARYGHGLEGAVVLDTYAGSGALGIEALSRGARACVFAERDAGALAVLRDNLRNLGLGSLARVVAADVNVAARGAAFGGEAFSLILLDPPYRIVGSEVRALLDLLRASGSVADDALIVWEHSSGHPPDWPDWIRPLSDRRYGSTTISIGEAGRARER